jgi:hypothetical protein
MIGFFPAYLPGNKYIYEQITFKLKIILNTLFTAITSGRCPTVLGDSPGWWRHQPEKKVNSEIAAGKALSRKVLKWMILSFRLCGKKYIMSHSHVN